MLSPLQKMGDVVSSCLVLLLSALTVSLDCGGSRDTRLQKTIATITQMVRATAICRLCEVRMTFAASIMLSVVDDSPIAVLLLMSRANKAPSEIAVGNKCARYSEFDTEQRSSRKRMLRATTIQLLFFTLYSNSRFPTRDN